MSEVKTNKISSLASNNDITIDPDGTGKVAFVSDITIDGDATFTLSTDATGKLADNIGEVGSGNFCLQVSNSSQSALKPLGFRAEDIRFATGSSERMRIDSSGNVGIGTSSATSPLHVSSSTTGNIANVVATNSSYGNDVLQVRCARSGATTEYNNLTVFDNNTSLKMLIRANGNLLNSNNSYGSLSDQTLKENIVDSASQWDDIKAVQIRKYNFIDSDETQIGVVAQELEAAGMDGLVESVEMYSSNEEDEPVRNGEFKKSVKYSVLHMKALKALQEAMNRIETLEARITALETE